AMSKRSRSTMGHASSSHNETMEEKVHKFRLFDNEDHQMNYNTLVGRSIHSGDVVDWEFLSNKGLAQYDPLHKGAKFRLGGMEREMHLLEFGWIVGQSREVARLSGLRNDVMVNATHFTHMFWPTIGDDGYNVGNTKAKSIRNPRIRLSHRCLTMNITRRKETTHRMGVIMELHEVGCYWPATREVTGEDGGDDEEGDGEGETKGLGAPRTSTAT
ncbi:hypothetical protein Tco_1411787, partial [Tanacetum coccineum]